MRYCCVVGCRNNAKKTKPDGKRWRLFRIPSNPEMRNQWLTKINCTGFNPSTHTTVCEDHFVDHEPSVYHPVPCLNMGYNTEIVKSRWRIKRTTPMKPTVGDAKMRKSDGGSHSGASPETIDAASDPSTVATCNQDEEPTDGVGNLTPALLDEIFTPQTVADTSMSTLDMNEEITPEEPTVEAGHTDSEPKALSKDVTISSLQRKLQILRRKIQMLSSTNTRFGLNIIENNDGKTRFYTGFPTWAAFSGVFERLLKKKMEKISVNNKARQQKWTKLNYKKPGPKRSLPLKEEFLLVMMKLRQGYLEEDLGGRFRIHQCTVSRIINKWIPKLAKCLKKMIKMPTKDQVRQNLPESFRKFPNTRVIIDCAELSIDRPTNVLARQLTWSNYKHHNTAKVLVGITPSGAISNLSKAWGGRASDKHIVVNTGFLSKLEPFDEVMADRGFDIADLLAVQCCTLNIPPFTKRKSQLSSQEVEKHRRISSLRIHVERAIERIKNFRILQGVYPLQSIHLLDHVLTICAAVTNFWPPLVPQQSSQNQSSVARCPSSPVSPTQP